MRILFLISVFFITACGGKTSPTQNISSQPAATPDTLTLRPGQAGMTNCMGNPGFSYAYYIPSHHISGTKSPVIMWFDSHAAGGLPIEKYRKLADKHGFIMVGSNSSKNGLQGPEYEQISKSLYNDVISRLPVD